jgi:hypothetical protein
MPYYPPGYAEQMAELQDEFVWESPEYERNERGPKWYIAMTVIAVTLVGYAIWTANFLFAFIILLAAIILVLAGNELPEKILIQIGHNGIVWNGEFIPYEKIHNFAIVYRPPDIRVLYIEPRMFRPRFRIPLGEQDPVAIRDHLRLYVAEDLDLPDEHASDIFAKLLRF